jgi:ribokinase
MLAPFAGTQLCTRVSVPDESDEELELRSVDELDTSASDGTPRVLVLGSINMDLHAETTEELIIGTNQKGTHRRASGGKGANEAVALAQLGIHTQLIGRVGKDGFGEELLASLPRFKVDIEGVTIDEDRLTGVAVIIQSTHKSKKKQTISCQGANEAVGAAELETLRRMLPGSSALVLQLEVNRDAVTQAAQAAHAAGKMVVLKASPCASTSDAPVELLRCCDLLFVNDFEASVLIGGQSKCSTLIDAARTSDELRSSGIGTVVITTSVAHVIASSGPLPVPGWASCPSSPSQGGGGASGDGKEQRAQPSVRARMLVVPIFPVDTSGGSLIGAADAFVGAFVSAIVSKRPIEYAGVRASCAGSFSTAKSGTWDSMPRYDELDVFMRKLGATKLTDSPYLGTDELGRCTAPAAEKAVLTADIGSLRQLPEGAELVKAHRDPLGQTLLHLAAMSSNEEVVAELLLHGVLLTALDSFDSTALDRAHSSATLANSPETSACRELILAAAVLSVVLSASSSSAHAREMQPQGSAQGNWLRRYSRRYSWDELVGPVGRLGRVRSGRLAFPRSEREVSPHTAAVLVFSLLAADSRQCQRLGAMYALKALHALRMPLERQPTDPSLFTTNAPLSPLAHHQASLDSLAHLGPTSGGARALALELLAMQAHELEGMTLLHLAAKRGEIDLMTRIKDLKKGNVTERTQKRQTALHIAAAAEQESVCVELLKWSPELMNMRDNEQKNARGQCSDAFWRIMLNHSETMGQLMPSAIGLAQRYVPHQHTAEQVGRRSVVRRALDKLTGDTVALKYFASKDERDQEHEVLQLVGPTVAPRVIDLFEDDSSELFDPASELSGARAVQYVLVMEAADTHHSLKDFIVTQSKEADNELILTATAKKILTIVNRVHSLGVVHMDLKPEHFMYFHGQWKLIDLGSALVVGAHCVHPAFTARYSAPEVAALGPSMERSSPDKDDQALTLSTAADIFSCGLILFEMFTGRPFFQGDMTHCELTNSKVRWRCLAYLHTQQKVFRLVLPMLNTEPALRPGLVELINRTFFRVSEDTWGRKKIEVLAIFSSPTRLRGRKHDGQHIPYLKLMRELMQLQEGIPEHQRVIRPAAKFPESIDGPLRDYSPRVIQFSGHASPEETKLTERQRESGIVGGTLLFESEDGTAQVPPPDEFVKMLYHQPQLQCIVLNACESEGLARRIVKAMPHLRVICWTTLVDNRAATAFSKGFFDSLGNSLRTPTLLNKSKENAREVDRIDRAFAAAAHAFAKAGFAFGDPRDKKKGMDGAPPPPAGKYAMVNSANVNEPDVAVRVDPAPRPDLPAPRMPHVMPRKPPAFRGEREPLRFDRHHASFRNVSA